MELLATVAGTPLFAPTLLLAVGHLVCRLLPLLSDRVNDRAVRLAEAKHAPSE